MLLWFIVSCRFFIGNQITELDRRLNSIKLPRIVSRSMRSISESEYYKSYEWKYILLIVSYPLLHDILESRYFIHLLKLIEAIHILCGTQITMEHLDRANDLLESYVEDFENLYGEENMVFNVHLLLHTAQCVRKNGPLQTYSNYAFEDYIGNLASLVKGPTDILNQITDRYLIKKNLESNLEEMYWARRFYRKIKPDLFSTISSFGTFLFVGNPIQIYYENFIRNNLQIIGDIICYRAVFVDKNVYFEIIDESIKTNDSFVCNPTEQIYAEIKCIFKADENVYFLINKKYTPITETSKPFVTELIETDDNFEVVNPSIVNLKYALVKLDNIITCTKFPNIIERN